MSSRLHPFARLCIAAVGLLASQVAAGLGLAAIYIGVKLAQSPGQPIYKIIGEVARINEANTLLLTLFVYPIGILWLGFCRAKFDKRSFISLGLRRSRLASNLARGLATGFLSIAVIWAILWVTGAISVNGFSAAARGPNVVLALLGYLIAFAAVGFFEEFLFRGYALHNLTNWLGWRGAVLVQATIFALIHLGNVATAPNEARVAALGAMPSIFLIGIFFALSYRKTGSLWFPIGFHAAWNFSLGCLFSLPVSGIKTFQLLDVKSQTQSWLSGGSFGAEGSFFLLPILGALIWFVLQAPDHPQALLDLELMQPEAAAPPIVAPSIAVTTAATAPASSEMGSAIEMELEPERENRYRTKFGTSEGFDGDILRELRELQLQRETAEAQTSQERAAQKTLDAEKLKPTVVAAPEIEPIASVEVVEAPEPIVTPTVVKSKVVEVIETPVEQKEVEEVAAPDEVDSTPQVEEKTENLAPAPVKKARPKW